MTLELTATCDVCKAKMETLGYGQVRFWPPGYVGRSGEFHLCPKHYDEALVAFSAWVVASIRT